VGEGVEIALGLAGAGIVDPGQFQLDDGDRRPDFVGDRGGEDLLRADQLLDPAKRPVHRSYQTQDLRNKMARRDFLPIGSFRRPWAGSCRCLFGPTATAEREAAASFPTPGCNAS
jgi:hypothetical protein